METTTKGMKTISLDMLSLDMFLTGKRENYVIIDRILRVLHHVRMYTGLPNSLYRVFFFFFNEINNTISIQIYFYPNPVAFQARPNRLSYERQN